MSKINTELFIARRISHRGGGQRGIMVRMATLSVTIGMAVMIVALAVTGGFKQEITDKLVGFGADIRIVGYFSSDGSYESMPVTRNEGLIGEVSEIDGVESVMPYITKSGIIRTPQAIHGVQLKGVAEDYDLSFFDRWLVEGELPQLADSVGRRDLLISRQTADMLGFEVGDKVEMMFVGEGNSVRRDLYKVCGLFSTGMDDFDRATSVTHIDNLRRLNRWDESQQTGFEVKLSDFKQLDRVAEQVEEMVIAYNAAVTNDHDMIYAMTIKQEYIGIFDWLATMDVNGVVIITIMLAVALLNMVSALLIILLERTSMIGLLKAVGMADGRLQRVFLYRAASIILRGMLFGNLLGMGIALVQKYTGLVKLDSSGYMLSSVPIELDLTWWLALNVGVPLVLLLLLTIPVKIVSAIKPDQTMRYQ